MTMLNPGYEGDSIENYQLEDESNFNSAGLQDDLDIVRLNNNPGNDFFRSEEMVLCQIFLQTEAAYASISELGELGLVQFRDLNEETNTFQRKFVHEVRRCDEMERKLKFLEAEIKKSNIRIPNGGEEKDEMTPPPREMTSLEATFEKLEQDVLEVNTNAEALKKNYFELTELKHVLIKAKQIFAEQDHLDINGEVVLQNRRYSVDVTGGQAASAASSGLSLGFVAGVIPPERMPAFEKMLWRACRGNVFLRQSCIEEPIEDPLLGGDAVRKSVFLIFFQGDQLKIRVKKICEGFRCTLYPCPEQAEERQKMLTGVLQQLQDLNTVIGRTNDHRLLVLSGVAKSIKVWFTKVRKIKGVYHTMNMLNLDVTQKCLIAECWLPSADINLIQRALRKGSKQSGSTVGPVINEMKTKEKPPTFFKTNKYTSAFQELIDSYGVATYQEVNPAVFTIITFPFLFGVMFGDAGHGAVVLAFSLWMCLREKQLEAKKIDSEIWQIFFAGRYLILLMSIFSIYSGIIYNDVFSKSLNIFGSAWHPSLTEQEILSKKNDMISPANNKSFYGSPYPFGCDPIWQLAINKIVFLNGFKMKFSIIIGVLQMLFGVCLSFWNHRYFRKPLNIVTEFIPQILFMCCMFGYLSLLMFIKWSKYYANIEPDTFALSERCAPSILITFINMVMFRGSVTQKGCEPVIYAGQQGFQSFMVILAAICVPWMLLARPLCIRQAHKKKLEAELREGKSDEEGLEEKPGLEEEFDFGEILILQGIHTIEYVLGSVSHTASYLRLWALSLAHAQLSEVLWNMVMRIGLRMGAWYGCIVLWAIFAFWAFLTVSILCLMEGLSAFLHTLRLHWVEFQSKFYKGEGYIFVPFSFKIILKQAEAA